MKCLLMPAVTAMCCTMFVVVSDTCILGQMAPFQRKMRIYLPAFIVLSAMKRAALCLSSNIIILAALARLVMLFIL